MKVELTALTDDGEGKRERGSGITHDSRLSTLRNICWGVSVQEGHWASEAEGRTLRAGPGWELKRRLHRGCCQGFLPLPLPCLLDEADDKFAHFNGLVCLESDDLLPISARRRVRVAPGSVPCPYTHPLSLLSVTHIQEVVQECGIFVDDQFLDLEGDWAWGGGTHI